MEERQRRRFEALLAQVRVNREIAAMHLSDVEGDENYQYCWVNRDDSRVIAYESMGYKIVKGSEAKTRWLRQDGTHVRGDAILMRVEKDLHEAYMIDNELRAVEAQEGAKDSFAAFAHRMRIPAWELSEDRT